MAQKTKTSAEKRRAVMLYAFRRLNKAKTNFWYGIEWKSSDGERVLLTFDKATVIELLPNGLSHRDLTEDGICIGEIYDNC